MFFSRRPESKLILLIEIQSSLIRGTVVRVAPAGSSVEAAQDIETDYRSDTTSAAYTKDVLSSASALIDSLLRAHSLRSGSAKAAAISDVHFILSSPWIISQAKTISISFDKDTPITEDRIHKILESERPELLFIPEQVVIS